MIINESNTLNEGIQVVKINDGKLLKQMKKYSYNLDSYLLFIEERYGLKDGIDYNLEIIGNTLLFTFNSNAKQLEIDKFKKELM